MTKCAEYGILLDRVEQKTLPLLHSKTAAAVAERMFGMPQDICQAISWHTTGKADMSLLEAIIYVADYMEPNRDFPGVERLRELAYTDIRGALKLGLEMTLEHLKEQGGEVAPASRQALDYLNR